MEENKPIIEEEYINITDLLLNYFHFFKRKWYLIIILALISALGVLVSVKREQSEYYTATVYYSLERTGNVYTDAAIATRVANGIGVISDLSDFRKDLLVELGDNYKPGFSSRFSGSATPEANLFSVTVVTGDADYANSLLSAFETVYPKWLHKTQGNTRITITDEALCEGADLYAGSLKKKILLGIIAVFGAWFAIATVSMILSRKVHSESEMSQLVDVKCLGILPDVLKKQREKSTKEVLLVNNEHIDPGYLQAIRALARRTEIMLTKEKRQIIMMASTEGYEGKSLITMNLAMILSRRGKKVVVIDSDFYRSGIMRILGISENTRGLLDFLGKDRKGMKIFHQKNGVVVVPAGVGVSENHDYVNVKEIETLFNVLRKKADVILVDTPSESIYNEAYAISELVDGVIYIVRGDSTEIRDVKKGLEPYIQNRKLCGYILNCVSHQASGSFNYGYGYGYSKYRNYGSYGGGNYGKYGYGYGSESGFIIDDIQREGIVENYTEELRKEQKSPVKRK